MYWIDEVQTLVIVKINHFLNSGSFFSPWTSEFRILWEVQLPVSRNYLWRHLISLRRGKPTFPTWNRQCKPADQTTTEISGTCRSHCHLYKHAFAGTGCRHSSYFSDGLFFSWGLLLSSPTLYPQLFSQKPFSVKVQIHAEEISEKALRFHRFRMSFTCLWFNKYKF